MTGPVVYVFVTQMYERAIGRKFEISQNFIPKINLKVFSKFTPGYKILLSIKLE